MSGHASYANAASEDLAAQDCLDSYNKRTLQHYVEPDADIHSQCDEEPGAEIDSDNRSQPDAESDDGQQRLPGPSLYGEKPPDSDNERIPSEIESETDNGQQKLPKPLDSDNKRIIGSSEHATIYKIPDLLKATKPEAYIPQMVALGPYHHDMASFVPCRRPIPFRPPILRDSSMEHYKQRFLRSDSANRAMNAIRGREPEIKACYEGMIEYHGNELSKMLFLDGCFILEVLDILGHSSSQPGNINASRFGGNMFAASNTLRDILMLENQVPWIVLQELNESENLQMEFFFVVLKATCGLFKMSWEGRYDESELKAWLDLAVKEAPHLLGFVHKVIVDRPSERRANPKQGISIRICIGRCLQILPGKHKAPNHDFLSIPPAAELKNAGIKFRPYNGGIMHITFEASSSTIYLPLLSITYDTEVLFRNLIAFEICRPSEVCYFSSYMNLMDNLIDSQKDVAFLRTTGILTNLLGSDKEVADLFNGLFKGITVRTPNMFDELKRSVNANYKNRIWVQLEELWRDHLSSPWKAIALLVAFVILCLTLTQTIYAIKQYLQGKQQPLCCFSFELDR